MAIFMHTIKMISLIVFTIFSGHDGFSSPQNFFLLISAEQKNRMMALVQRKIHRHHKMHLRNGLEDLDDMVMVFQFQILRC